MSSDSGLSETETSSDNGEANNNNNNNNDDEDVDNNNNNNNNNNDNNENLELEQRISAGVQHIAANRISVKRFDRQMDDNKTFQVHGKYRRVPALQFGLITNPENPAMPRVYMSKVGNPRGNTTVHFHLTSFIALCKTVIKFYKHKIVGDNYTLGLNSYMSFCNGGERNKILQICIYLAYSDTSVEFHLDSRMQRQFLCQYKPMYKYSLRMLSKITEDDIVLINMQG